MDQNEVAVEIAKREGGEKQTDIAQIKEVVHIYNELIKEKTSIDIPEVLRKSQ